MVNCTSMGSIRTCSPSYADSGSNGTMLEIDDGRDKWLAPRENIEFQGSGNVQLCATRCNNGHSCPKYMKTISNIRSFAAPKWPTRVFVLRMWGALLPHEFAIFSVIQVQFRTSAIYNVLVDERSVCVCLHFFLNAFFNSG